MEIKKCESTVHSPICELPVETEQLLAELKYLASVIYDCTIHVEPHLAPDPDQLKLAVRSIRLGVERIDDSFYFSTRRDRPHKLVYASPHVHTVLLS
jgi:hypothetical protein